jgi:hypothetical protein
MYSGGRAPLRLPTAGGPGGSRRARWTQAGRMSPLKLEAQSLSESLRRRARAQAPAGARAQAPGPIPRAGRAGRLGLGQCHGGA